MLKFVRIVLKHTPYICFYIYIYLYYYSIFMQCELYIHILTLNISVPLASLSKIHVMVSSEIQFFVWRIFYFYYNVAAVCKWDLKMIKKKHIRLFDVWGWSTSTKLWLLFERLTLYIKNNAQLTDGYTAACHISLVILAV